MNKNKRNKIGRNQCSCGSGKKYKRCHGTGEKFIFPTSLNPFNELEKHKITDIQRKLQQGLGRNIISATVDGHRALSVGKRIYYGKWNIFRDFLMDYLKLGMNTLFFIASILLE